MRMEIPRWILILWGLIILSPIISRIIFHYNEDKEEKKIDLRNTRNTSAESPKGKETSV